ncbi:MAG: hypothetical protein AAB454_00760 [Patescibacteria group bacterium]
MKTIIGFSLLVIGILFAVFVYNNLMNADLKPYYSAVISEKAIDLIQWP